MKVGLYYLLFEHMVTIDLAVIDVEYLDTTKRGRTRNAVTGHNAN